MCGVAGLIRHGGRAPGDSEAVARMTAAQAHRGPDGVNFFADDYAVLGHRRLSIIDLSPAGVQPMPNEDRSVWVTYNGEIYNHADLRDELASFGHRFRSRTDTEVLVHGYEQWGIDGLLSRLRGMFAFGLYDTYAGLFLARDQVGIKPLYYRVDRSCGLLLFASELKALAASGLVSDAHDRRALVGFLLAGSVPAPRTILKDVESLLPGQYLTWRDGRVTLKRYWHLPEAARPDDVTGAADAVSGLRPLLSDAVARHLVSDVPVGIFLGGGVDSTAIVAFARRCVSGDAVRTLTVTFDEEEFTEASAARAAAVRFGTDHQEVHVTRSDFVDTLPKLFDAMDQPTNDGVNTYFVSKAAREAGLTVVLSGLGGDELFWGYRHYHRIAALNRIAGGPSLVRAGLASAAALYGKACGRDNWMRAAFLTRGGSPAAQYLLLRGFFPPAHLIRLLDLSYHELDELVDEQFARLESVRGEAAGSVNRIEFQRYLHDQLLRDTDVFSMAHSIEVRVPLLALRVVEYTLPLDSRVKLNRRMNKPLLVAATDDPLVTAAGRSPKRGFSFPMERWMRAAAGELEERAISTGLVERRAAANLWKAFRHGRLHWSRAWALTVLASVGGNRKGGVPLHEFSPVHTAFDGANEMRCVPART